MSDAKLSVGTEVARQDAEAAFWAAITKAVNETQGLTYRGGRVIEETRGVGTGAGEFMPVGVAYRLDVRCWLDEGQGAVPVAIEAVGHDADTCLDSLEVALRGRRWRVLPNPRGPIQ